ncbi:MAG: hypothetical protein JWM28_1137 [Chitinophagaceae bacterium]|nr:hypothetical protein [Chitinophagaceae bacterium]
MKQIWFKPTGWIYLPVNAMGFLITLLAIVFMLPVCTAVFRNGHSLSDDLYQVFVYGTCTAFWLKWIAEKTSDQKINQK